MLSALVFLTLRRSAMQEKKTKKQAAIRAVSVLQTEMLKFFLFKPHLTSDVWTAMAGAWWGRIFISILSHVSGTPEHFSPPFM